MRVKNPNKVIRWRGGKCTRRMKAFIQAWEESVGGVADIYQLSFNPGGVAASAGAHDKAGAVDALFHGKDNDEVLTKGKRLGLCVWHRHEPEFPEHDHGILRGDTPLSPVAAQQIPLFDQGLDGLVDNRPDENPWRPRFAPVTFNYLGWCERATLRRRIRCATRTLNHTVNPVRQRRIRKRRRELRARLHDVSITK